VAAAPLLIEQEYENSRNSGAATGIIVQGQAIVQKGTTYNGTVIEESHTAADLDKPTANHVTENDTTGLVDGLIPLSDVMPASGGTSDKLYSAAQEIARNSGASVSIIKQGETVKQINIDYLGTYSESLAAPGASALGTPEVLSNTSIRVFYGWPTTATKLYLERSTDGATWGTAVEMTAGTYYTDVTGLTAGIAYYWRARAWNSTGYSAYSTSVTATTRTTNQTEQALWATFKTKMQADTYLASYIQKWKFDKAGLILSESKTPVFKAWILDTSEDWKGIPKSKIVRCRVIIHGLVKVANSVNLETEKLKFDEYVKNAIEADMTLAGGVTMCVVGDTIFSNLDDSTAEIAITCEVLSSRFTAGAR
jgi:hypothetical protein